MAAGSWPLLLRAVVAVSPPASWLPVSWLERLGERAAFSQAGWAWSWCRPPIRRITRR